MFSFMLQLFSSCVSEGISQAWREFLGKGHVVGFMVVTVLYS